MDRLTRGARRILDVAARLFYERGIHAVGVDLIAGESGVTKRTLYDRFGAKDTLVVAYLRERDERWRRVVDDRVAQLVEPADRVLAPFDVLPGWMAGNSRGCAFVNAAAEIPDPDHPARAVVVAQKEWLSGFFVEHLVAAGAGGVAAVAEELRVLHEGALAVVGVTGSPDAVEVARRAARVLRDRVVPI